MHTSGPLLEAQVIYKRGCKKVQVIIIMVANNMKATSTLNIQYNYY